MFVPPPPPPPTKFFITFVFLFLLNFSFFPGKIEDNYAKFEGEGANKMHYEVQIANKSEVSEHELSLSIRCWWYSNLWLNCQKSFSLQAFQSYLVLPPTDRNFKDHIWASGFPKLASKMKSFKYNKTCNYIRYQQLRVISFGNAAIGIIDTVLESASPRTWMAHLQRCILLKKKKDFLY